MMMTMRRMAIAQTMYHSSFVNVTDFLTMSMSNRSYQYYTGTPLFPFVRIRPVASSCMRRVPCPVSRT